MCSERLEIQLTFFCWWWLQPPTGHTIKGRRCRHIQRRSLNESICKRRPGCAGLVGIVRKEAAARASATQRFMKKDVAEKDENAKKGSVSALQHFWSGGAQTSGCVCDDAVKCKWEKKSVLELESS